MRSLSRLLAPERMVWLSGGCRDGVLKELADVHALMGAPLTSDEILKALIEREELNSTGIGNGLALPHARLDRVEHFSLALGLHAAGVDFAAFDGAPVRLLLTIIGPSDTTDLYVQILARASRFLRDRGDRILSAASAQEIYDLTLEY